MIRGFIEVVTHEMVQGWIHCADGTTRDKLVLAFSGDRCVGSGKVELFRRDLAEAGVGDGYLGFSFGITVEPAAVGSVVVTLEGSDAVLLQPGARVSQPGDDAPQTGPTAPADVAPPGNTASLTPPAVARQLAALAWQLRHARLSQADYDYLKMLWSVGIYERTLLRRDAPGKPAVADDAITVAAGLLEAYLGTDAEIDTVASITALAFRDTLDRVQADSRTAPVVALCSHHRLSLRALEGSHIKDDENKGTLRRGNPVDFRINPEHVVLLDVRAAAELYAPAGQSVSMLTARPAS